VNAVAPPEKAAYVAVINELCDCTLSKAKISCSPALNGATTASVVCGNQRPQQQMEKIDVVAAVVDAHSDARKPLVLVSLWGDMTVINTKARQKSGGLLSVPFQSWLLQKNAEPASQAWLDRVLNKPALLQLFSRNPMIWHPKVVALPIGMASHLSAQPLFEVAKTLEKQPKTHHILNQLWRVGALWLQPHSSPRIYRFRFAISPPDNGWDCYRTWEAIWLGVIPIVIRTGTSFDRLFDELPVLLVDDYADVTLALLDATYDAFEARDFDLSKLTAAHWFKKIRRAKAVAVRNSLT